IGSIGGDFLVTWTEGAENCQLVCFPDLRDILGKRVSSTGAILDANPILIATGKKDQAYPHVASDANDYFIVYNYWFDLQWTTAVKRLTKNGQLVDSLATEDGVILGTN